MYYLDGETFLAVVSAIAASLVWDTYFYDEPDERGSGGENTNGGEGERS